MVMKSASSVACTTIAWLKQSYSRGCLKEDKEDRRTAIARTLTKAISISKVAKPNRTACSHALATWTTLGSYTQLARLYSYQGHRLCMPHMWHSTPRHFQSFWRQTSMLLWNGLACWLSKPLFLNMVIQHSSNSSSLASYTCAELLTWTNKFSRTIPCVTLQR